MRAAYGGSKPPPYRTEGEQMTGLLVVGIVAAAVAALIVLACCKVSGDCAREEEKRSDG